MRVFAILLLLSVAAGCGPTVVKTRPLEEIGMLAVLPTKADPDIRRERVKYLNESLSRELESSGYSVINSDVISDLCSTSDCPERAAISSKFGVRTFAQLDVSSASRANFVAGFYNKVAGKLVVSDEKAAPFVSIEHTESEHGGLIFQSGQIFKGISSTVDNYGDDKFSDLADLFIREVVSKLPKANARSDSESFYINKLSLSMREGPLYDICLDGSPSNSAKLLIGNRQIGLREVQSGKYCNVIPLGWLTSGISESRAELRSAFGQSLAKPLDTLAIGICDPKQELTYKDGLLGFSCGNNNCASASPLCQHSKFLVFSGESKAGPYTKVSEVLWNKSAVKIESRNVAVVALSSDGSSSLPVIFSGSSNE
jgi:hypothetical protein